MGIDHQYLRFWKHQKSLDLFENTLDSWINNARPKEIPYSYYEDDFDTIYNNLDSLKKANKKGCNLMISVGYSKQIFFPSDFNIIKEKRGFIKLIREPGEIAEQEYIRFKPKKLIAKLAPFSHQNCVLVSSDEGEIFNNMTNDFYVEQNEVYAPFEKRSLYDSYNLAYNVIRENTPILFFPRGSDFLDKTARAKTLRKFWHYVISRDKKKDFLV